MKGDVNADRQMYNSQRMNCCCAPIPNGLDKVFNERQARRDAQAYLKKGLDGPGRRLVEVLRAQGVAGASVLEVGGGAGGLHLELLRAGAGHAVDLDLAPAYLKVASETAAALGLGDAVEHRLHNIAEEPQAVAPADIVVLNRVVCCYPHMEKLVRPAAERAQRLLALTFPRDAWWVRWPGQVMNAGLWLFRNDYRLYLHPPPDIYALAAACGLSPIHQSFSGLWQIAVFQRA